ncbi:MAG: hypothetical protein DLM52_11560 [Chthoniobacterales bacterium]|nr:MAG: hypothetical protein DLM52_11560 [Chthoniobacterales bacterium]
MIRISHTVSLQRTALALLLALGVSQAKATLVALDLNPSGLNAPVGSSSNSYTQSGYTITATGYDNPTTTHELFFKNGGVGETGLGLVNTNDNELQVNNGVPANYIQLDLHTLLSAGFTNGKIEVGSVQPNESFSLYGSSTAGTLGAFLGTFGSSSNDLFVDVPKFGTYDYVSVAAASADVLPVAFEAVSTPVPEMNALLPIVGLLSAVAVGEVLRRRKLALTALN